MDCAAVKPRMEALVQGSLPEEERALAEQHIAACEGCRLELELVRAIGSQEKPGAGPREDWTIDRIFGSSPGAPGAPPAPPEAAPLEVSPLAPPEPASAPPSASGPPEEPPFETTPETTAAVPTPSPAPVMSADAGGTAKSASWDFEPADAKAAVKPPEQSLFFATEALSRRGSRARKGSKARVVLWGLGGLAGAALLSFSAWFVLHMGSGPEPVAPVPNAAPAPNPAGATDGTQSEPAPVAPAPDPLHPPAANGEPPESAPSQPDNSAQSAPQETPRAPAPAETPRVTASSTAPQPMALGTSPTVEGALRHPASAPKALASKPPAPRNTTIASNPPKPRVTEAPRPAPAVSSTESTSRDTSSEGDDDEDTPAPAPAVVKPAPARPSASRSSGSPMWRSQTPKPEPEAERETETAPMPSETPAAPANTPIERLHLATVAAEEKGDVDTLRRLRSSWKTFMGKIIGPDRSRAKREYADCLWAIQDLTGRRSDQKDALAAYREYLLGAPAGGADSRSVSRLRQLEDAFAEHR
jgi:hypothetical protein